MNFIVLTAVDATLPFCLLKVPIYIVNNLEKSGMLLDKIITSRTVDMKCTVLSLDLVAGTH